MFKGLMEQIKFTSEQELIQAKQALEAAQVAEGSARSSLMILGYGKERGRRRWTRSSQGEEVAHYTIDAPFAGTIIAKDVVIDERVGPDTKLFDLTDLSTVWVQADVYEKDLSGWWPDLQGPDDPLRTDAYPGRTFEAEVFYAGDIVDPGDPHRAADGRGRQPRSDCSSPGSSGDRAAGGHGPIRRPGADVGHPRRPGRDLRLRPARRARNSSAGRDGRPSRTERVVEIVAGLAGGEPVVVGGTFALKAEMKAGAGRGRTSTLRGARPWSTRHSSGKAVVAQHDHRVLAHNRFLSCCPPPS